MKWFLCKRHWKLNCKACKKNKSKLGENGEGNGVGGDTVNGGGDDSSCGSGGTAPQTKSSSSSQDQNKNVSSDAITTCSNAHSSSLATDKPMDSATPEQAAASTTEVTTKPEDVPVPDTTMTTFAAPEPQLTPVSVISASTSADVKKSASKVTVAAHIILPAPVVSVSAPIILPAPVVSVSAAIILPAPVVSVSAPIILPAPVVSVSAPIILPAPVVSVSAPVAPAPVVITPPTSVINPSAAPTTPAVMNPSLPVPVTSQASSALNPVAIQPKKNGTSSSGKSIQNEKDTHMLLEVVKDLSINKNLVDSIVGPDDPDYTNIMSYISHGQLHNYKIKVLSIIRILPQAPDLQKDPQKSPVRTMLWHGTPRSTIIRILEKGFTLPPYTGQMFGTGIYLADVASKSAQYCWKKETAKTYYLLLCNVHLGNFCKCFKADNSLKAPPKSYDSVKGVGRTAPDRKDDKIIDGCLWPLGKNVRNTEHSTPCKLNYNEYIVYDPKKIQPKYLVRFEQSYT